MKHCCWCSEKLPIQTKITTTRSARIYVKCIRLMHNSYGGERLCFSNVDEVLDILPIASDLLFHHCLEECLRYLNVVSWSTKQEVKLRALLLSLEINTLPDLAVRLGMIPDHGGLQRMLSNISSGSCDYREYIEEYIVAHFETNASFAEMCRYALLRKFSANVECAKSNQCGIYFAQCWDCPLPHVFPSLSWIVNVTQRCDGELFETVLKMFCEDAKLSSEANPFPGYCNAANPFAGCFIRPQGDLFDRFLTALGNGRIITSTSFRVSFLINWAHVLLRLCNYRVSLERKVIDVAETLPPLEQRRICNIWKPTLTAVPETIKGSDKKTEEAIFLENRVGHLLPRQAFYMIGSMQ